MSHYFSKVRLRAMRSRDPWLIRNESQGDAYRDHQIIWRLFASDGGKRDFIFRRLDDMRTYYVVSERPPHDEDGRFDIQSKAYDPSFDVGDTLRFDLRANPVVSRRAAEGGKSRRHDMLMNAKKEARQTGHDAAVAMDEAGLKWILERAAHWGLRVDERSVLQKGYCQHALRPGRWRETGEKHKAIQFSSLDYQGVAEVVDPEALRKALFEGVGHAKSFGCGLLLVRPLC